MKRISKIWNWIVSWFRGGEVKAVKIIGKKLCMPLFYPGVSGGTDGTWNYLSKSETDRKYCRDQIKAVAVRGEQPAIAFLLSPSDEAGRIWNPFPALNQSALKLVREAMRELCEENIAVFVTLYNDDPAGSMPKWWEIESYKVAWGEAWKEVGQYVSGCILSIESNERTSSVGQLQHRIQIMSEAMPGAQIYGTHMAYLGRGLPGYQWASVATTPVNAGIILVENSWQPQAGDSAGVEGVRREWDGAAKLVDMRKVVWHEYNYNPGGETCKAQREFFRSREQWGVG